MFFDFIVVVTTKQLFYSILHKTDIAITEIIVVAVAIVYSLLLLLVAVLVVPVVVVDVLDGELATGEGVGGLLVVVVPAVIPQYFWQTTSKVATPLTKSLVQSPPIVSPEGHVIPQGTPTT